MKATNLPQFTLVIPVLNEEKTIHHLLADLDNQTFKNFEVVIVDGHSQDKTLIKIAPFTRKLNLTVLDSPIRNVCHQRNLGATVAKSSILIFMDADNRLPSYFLQGIKYQLEVHQSHIFTTWISTDTADADPIIPTVINWYSEIQKSTSNPFVIESMLGIQLKLFQKLKGFDPKLPMNEGSDLLKRALQKGITIDVYKDPRYLYSFRRLKRQGSLNIFTTVVQTEIAKALGIKLSADYQKKIYPMKGGKYFDDEESNFFNRLLDKLKLNGTKERLTNTVKKILFED